MDQPEKTVFVVGAGASKEFDLPTGVELKQQISAALDSSHIDDGVRTPENVLGVALAEAGLQLGRGLGAMARAAALVASAMPQALSIDNFLHQHRDDRTIEICGKLAIVQLILAAESKSLLSDSEGGGKRHRSCPFALNDVEHTWANRLAQLLFAGCTADDLELRFRRVAFVIFNYDRCLERFVYFSLQNVYGDAMPPARAEQLMRSLEIHHPYGSVGDLEFMTDQNATATRFGASLNSVGLRERVDLIRTFTETVETQRAERIRDLVHGSLRLVFLGFSYGVQNVELLLGPSRDRDSYSPCFGTCYQMSGPNVAVAKLDLKRRKLHGTIDLADLRCGEFVDQYSGHLRFE